MQRILVPVDYSEAARRALQMAGYVAQQFGATITALHVWDCPPFARDALVHDGDERRPVADLIVRNAEQEMKTFLEQTQLAAEVPLEQQLVCGEPAQAILHYVEEHPQDLIVMATHSRAGVRHMLLGNVTTKVLGFSPIPVLSVPAT